ncbi:hypothetical protein GQ42DRAFT_33536 [Ramicandelaber brevisporus]|nr:hypothetical protein GQ42DRAFT_33536 [Ramicandelaber brevisporus]
MPDIHAPADFHTVTSTFRFDINGSNLGGISMHASISRSPIQHIHPPQSVACYLFLKGITRRGNGAVRSSSSSSSSSSSQLQLQQQSQHSVSSSSSSTTTIISPPPQLQKQSVSATKKRDRKKLTAYNKKYDGKLKSPVDTLRGLVGASPSLSKLKVVQNALQTISPTTIPISTWDYRGIIKQFRDAIPGTQSSSKPKLLDDAINFIESHNLQSTISTSGQEQQVQQQQQQQQQRQRQAARAASFHNNQQQLSHSCPPQEQNTTSDPVSTSTAAPALTSVSQWQQQQHQHQHQHQHQQHQQPHPSVLPISIVSTLPLEGSDIAEESFPQLPPPAFPISPSSSTQQQKPSPPSATVLNEVKSSQPRRQYQPRKNTYTSSYGSSLSELQQQPFNQHSRRPILTQSAQQPQSKYEAEQKELYSQLYDMLDGTRLLSKHALINTATDFISERKKTSHQPQQ